MVSTKVSIICDFYLFIPKFSISEYTKLADQLWNYTTFNVIVVTFDVMIRLGRLCIKCCVLHPC